MAQDPTPDECSIPRRIRLHCGDDEYPVMVVNL